MSQLASADAAEQKRLNEIKAQKSADRSALVGQVAGAALMFMSSEDFKHDKAPASGLLEKLKKVRVDNWKYRGDDHTNHIGPYAQEFNDTFGVGQDDKQRISIIDMLGVTMGAVKELSEKVDVK